MKKLLVVSVVLLSFLAMGCSEGHKGHRGHRGPSIRRGPPRTHSRQVYCHRSMGRQGPGHMMGRSKMGRGQQGPGHMMGRGQQGPGHKMGRPERGRGRPSGK
jgi:hypothetical protein